MRLIGLIEIEEIVFGCRGILGRKKIGVSTPLDDRTPLDDQLSLSGSGNIANINGIDLSAAIYYATVVVPNSFRKSVKMVIMK